MWWFTSDTHFSHVKADGTGGILKYQPNRGAKFSSIEDMNEHLIQQWNKNIKRGDVVYHLGDFAWRGVDGSPTDANLILHRLNGQKFMILGTHDSEAQRLKHHFVQQVQIKEVDIEGQHVVMGHYAQRVWNRSHYGSWHMYGHSHDNLPSFGKSFDAGVDTKHLDSHEPFTPYSWIEVKEIMFKLVNNWVDARYMREKKEIG